MVHDVRTINICNNNMANMKELSIVIPAYNEEKRIGATLSEYTRFLDNKIDYEILVVLNGCRDKTLDVVKKHAAKSKRVRYVDIKEAIGKGGAVVEGFKIVNGKYIAFVDADSSTEPDQLFFIYNKIKNSNYDGVIGSRWVKGARIKKYQPLKRIIASRAYNLLVRVILFLPYKDSQCGAKVFKNNAIKSILNVVIPVGWEFDVALLYALRKKGFKVREVPIVWSDKAGSNLKITKTAPKMLKSLIRIRFGNSIFGRFL